MHRLEAMELLNEITACNPDLISQATRISLHFGEKLETRIIIKTELDETQREMLENIVAQRNLKLVYSSNVWVIF